MPTAPISFAMLRMTIIWVQENKLVFNKRQEMYEYYVYIMSNKTRMIYVGVTNDLERRVYEHKNKLVPGFTSRYNLDKLVYFDSTNDITAAIEREKEIKGWVRRKKTALINSMNPEWKDLAEEWYNTPVILSETKNIGEGQ